MKKLFLFLTVLTFGISLSSCLSVGSQNFTETSIVYIDNHGFTTYGKTLSGRGITNDRIRLMESKTFKIISYSWEEEMGMTELDGTTLYNVAIAGDPIDLPQTRLVTGQVEFPKGVGFNEVKAPAYDNYGVYFDDFWLFEYSYKAKEGQKPSVSFFQRQSDSSTPDIIEVDIRLSLVGEAKDGADEKLYGDLVAVDMQQIRQQFLGPSNSSVKLKFYYYEKEGENLTSSQNTYEMTHLDR